MKVHSIESLTKHKKHRKLYLSEDCTDEYMTEKVEDYFDLFMGQVIYIGSFGQAIPAVVTKVHEKDINLHNTYDLAILVNGNKDSDFTSVIHTTERYAWRFIDKSESETVNEELLNEIKNVNITEWVENFDNSYLCFVDKREGKSNIVWPFNKE